MSNFSAPTRHPQTGKIEMAEWLDDYYGRHRYAVRFFTGTPDEVTLCPEVHDLKPLRPPIIEPEEKQ